VVALAVLSMFLNAFPPAPATIRVTIDQAAFRETTVSAHVGDTIDWSNKDIVDHTATAKNGAFNVEIPAGKKARVVLKQTGEVQYYCESHSNMTARVVVTKAK
jgi:plastocyanin